MIQLCFHPDTLDCLWQSAAKYAYSANPEALQWHLFAKVVQGRQMVFAMDVKTLYWMCFEFPAGADKESFLNYFCRQIMDQALGVCDLSAAEHEELSRWIVIALDPIEMHAVSEGQLHRNLKRQASFIIDLMTDDYPIPETPSAWLQLGVPFNRSIHSRDEQSPIGTFQNFWLGLLQFMQRQQTGQPVKPPQTNIIPFRPKPR